MKKLFFSVAILLIMVSCNFSEKKQSSDQNSSEIELKSDQEEILTVEKLLANPEVYLNKNISLQGLCVHTCKHSGKKMFLQGTNEDELVLVLAGDNVPTFEQELTGSQVIVTGLLTAKESEMDEHASGDNNCETESKSKSYQLSCTAYRAVSE